MYNPNDPVKSPEAKHIVSLDDLAGALAKAEPSALQCLLNVTTSTYRPDCVMGQFESAEMRKARHNTIKAAWRVFFLTVPGMPKE